MKWTPLLLTLVSLTTLLHSQSPCGYENPNCLPPLENDENLFPRCKEIYGNVEFLYWTVGEGALDYSIKQSKSGWASEIDPHSFANGKLNNASYHWNPGVRLLVGYYNAPKYWELIAQYTYINLQGRNDAHKPKSEEENLYLNATFPQVFDTPLDRAKSEIDLNYQVADILFSRVFDPNPHLRMRLIAGVTTAFINQSWKIRYFDDQDSNTKVSNKWKFNAGGLRIGLSSDWWWKWSLYFTGKVTLAGYTGRYKNHAQIHTNFTPDESTSFNTDANVMYLTNNDYRYVQHLQMIIGPSWHQVCQSFHYEVFLGYELNGWFNLQEIYKSQESERTQPKSVTINTGTLCLHGLTLRLTLGF